MVGVWDTVGSIGLPFGRLKNISRGMLKFHNTNLSTTIEHSYQALAAGEAAQRAFLEIRDAKTSVVRKVELEEGLRRYCERDTWGLVVLRRFLCGE